MLRNTLCFVVVASLLLAVPVAGAAGSGVDPKDGPVSPTSIVGLAGNSAPPDAYEPDGHSGFVPWDDIRDIQPLLPRWGPGLPGWGIEPYTEQHTIDTATITEWDEDWFRLNVPSADFSAWPQLSYRFDAYSTDRTVDLVLDVYAAAPSFAAGDAVSGEDPLALVSNDDSPWVYYSRYSAWGRWSSVTFIPPAAGTYYIRVRPLWGDAVSGFTNRAG
ncbi:MAG: hypothetical protein U1E08_04520, partial [Coriobacteriia bacterium]|nr:hypothetical protein [Coriobacteriia bacterium]